MWNERELDGIMQELYEKQLLILNNHNEFGL